MTTELRLLLRADGLNDDITTAERLTGGAANSVWLVTWADGTRRVLKHAPGAPDGLFPAEAEGLRALADAGGLTVPEVHHVSDRLLLLQALTPSGERPPRFWEETGRALAALHSVSGARHGWHRDGWLGRLPQDNTWSDDGYEFYATRRILRYLREPLTEQTLTPQDRAAVERICARLPEFVPPTPPALTHGDLWHANVVATAQGAPAFIDPAVSYTWPDVDLSMYHAYAQPADSARFFAAYAELRPLGDGWRERMEILFLRELLSVIAHEGDRSDSVARLRDLTARYA